MSLNTAHLQGGGVLIHAGECILIFCDKVTVDFHGQENPAFSHTKKGSLYLTTHRLIFINKRTDDKMCSFSIPFVAITDIDIEQPVFGANLMKGKVRAQDNGNWVGEVKFKIIFRTGGAIEFANAMKVAIDLTARNGSASGPPPPYVPPSTQYYQAPPPMYAPPTAGYYGWVPPTNVFPQPPPANSVYVTDMPPPYPGINTAESGYAAPNQFNTGNLSAATAPNNFSVGYYGMGYPGYPPPFGGNMPPNAASGQLPNNGPQNAYYDPNNPQCAYVSPPPYAPSPAYPPSGDKKSQ